MDNTFHSLNMRIYLYTYIIVFMVFFMPIKIYSQHYIGISDSWKISGFIGTSNFHGDITDNTNSFINNTPFSKYFYQDRKMGGGIYVDKMFGNVMGVRGVLMFSDMKSSKESDKIYFTGNTFEYSIAAYSNLSNLFFGYSRRRNWDVYVFLGIGYSETRSTAYSMTTGAVVGSTGYKKSNDGNRFLRMTEVVVPVGLGASYKFSKIAYVFVEVTRHFVNTNKLDAYPVEGTAIESLGLLNIGLSYNFALPSHWQIYRTPRYNGKSPDPAIRAFNKRKHVVMKTKANKKALKRRKRYGRKRFKRHRW